MKLTYIRWCDAMSMQASWSSKETVIEWGKSEEWVCEEVGWVIQETKEYILFSNQRAHAGTPEEAFSNVTKIPKTFIRERYTLSKEIK